MKLADLLFLFEDSIVKDSKLNTDGPVTLIGKLFNLTLSFIVYIICAIIVLSFFSYKAINIGVAILLVLYALIFVGLIVKSIYDLFNN